MFWHCFGRKSIRSGAFNLPPWFGKNGRRQAIAALQNGSAVDHAHLGAFSLYANDAKSFSGQARMSEHKTQNPLLRVGFAAKMVEVGGTPGSSPLGRKKSVFVRGMADLTAF
jgi:hypothetical protein